MDCLSRTAAVFQSHYGKVLERIFVIIVVCSISYHTKTFLSPTPHGLLQMYQNLGLIDFEIGVFSSNDLTYTTKLIAS